jgi:LmbE family N-acetylglucosaminyl deacetylase
MLTLSLAKSSGSAYRILCLGAHSDDIEIGCGGTILTLLHRLECVEVHWVIFSASPERALEGRNSADRFLAKAAGKVVTIQEFRDGFFPYQATPIKEAFESLKTEVQPDLIFTHYRDDRHQDHRLLSDLTWNTFRNHLILEYEIPKYDGDIGTPNVFVPLEEAVCREKARLALNHFPSQASKQWFDEETIVGLARLRGMEANSPTRFAEAFYCRKVVLGWS